MTAKKKYVSGDVHPDDAHGVGSTEIPASQPAEAEKNVVGEAQPVERKTAEAVAAEIADIHPHASVAGNRLTILVDGPHGLHQIFHATVEESIREF